MTVGGRTGLAVAMVVAIAAVSATTALADRAVVGRSAPGPWAGGASVQTPTERLAARIASRIAGHAVTVRCDTASVFRAFGGGDATGSVPNRVDPTTGRYAETSRVIHLNPGTCGSLQAFAQAPVKPTRCKDAANRAVPCFTARRVTPATARESYLCAPRPSGCFAVGTGNSAFWHRYARDAYAIWVLAHEAIHAGQAVKGAPQVADNVVEVQADCYGLQWIPSVATQLGDRLDDAEAIASYDWLIQYPQKSREPPRPYWSSACHAGGALDIRAAGSTFWP